MAPLRKVFGGGEQEAEGEVALCLSEAEVSSEGLDKDPEAEPENPPIARFEEGCVISAREPSIEPEADQDDEFTEAEWLSAQEKLRSIERTTGLTFVQRARLCRALSAGGVIEVPVFQQRYGPLPAWMVGPEVGREEEGLGGAVGSGSSEEVPCVVDFEGFLEANALSMMILLGHAAPELAWVQMLARGFHQSAPIRLMGRFRDTGVQAGPPAEGEGRVVFRFNPVEQGASWVPVSLVVESGVQVSSFVLGGNQADSAEIGESLQVQNPADSAEIGGSLQVQNRADSAEIGGSLQVQNRADSAEIGGSRESSVRVGDREVPSPEVQVGGSASSTDPCPPTPAVQHGGSSSSHGMGTTQGTWGFCYEDIAEDGALQGEFPMIGTWFQTHYMVHVLSVEGERVLWFLARVPDWKCLRVSSNYLRYAVASAVVDVLRRGVYAVWFSGPQWLSAVEDYIVMGVPYEGEEELVEGEAAGRPTGPWVHQWAAGSSEAPHEVPDVADAYFRGDEVDVDDDPWLDEMPLRTAQLPGPVVRLEPIAQALFSSSSEEGSDSTAEPSEPSLRTPEGGSEAEGEERDEVQGFGGLVGPVYSAGEGVLLCTYVDDVLQVPLPGWSCQEIETIVHGLQTGDWAGFQQILSTEPSESTTSAAPPGHGETGLGSTSDRQLFRVVETSWRPRRLVALWWFLLLWMIWCGFQVAGSAVVEATEIPLVPLTNDEGCRALQVRPEAQDVDFLEGEIGCDGGFVWEGVKAALVIMTWEFLRWIGTRAVAGNRRSLETGSQTSSEGVVVMPLQEGMRCRGKILFCFWRSGLKVEIEEYPERIQSEFHSLVGAYLGRLEEGFVSESDSD